MCYGNRGLSWASVEDLVEVGYLTANGLLGNTEELIVADEDFDHLSTIAAAEVGQCLSVSVKDNSYFRDDENAIASTACCLLVTTGDGVFVVFGIGLRLQKGQGFIVREPSLLRRVGVALLVQK